MYTFVLFLVDCYIMFPQGYFAYSVTEGDEVSVTVPAMTYHCLPTGAHI